jgi:hypothetical protein
VVDFLLNGFILGRDQVVDTGDDMIQIRTDQPGRFIFGFSIERIALPNAHGDHGECRGEDATEP